MQNHLLTIENLTVCPVQAQNAPRKEILQSLNLSVNKGEVHVIMGPNGAGKSTLAAAILGDPRFFVAGGRILFEGKDITGETTDARARRGLFLSFQAPEEIPGVTMEEFLRAAKAAQTGQPVKLLAFRKEVFAALEELDMPRSAASRYVNVGFSGGEKKKSEVFQLSVLNPKLAILDESDSGLDVDAARIVSRAVGNFANSENAVLIITHSTRILQSVPVDFVHILAEGRIMKTGGAELIDEINQTGFTAVTEGSKAVG